MIYVVIYPWPSIPGRMAWRITSIFTRMDFHGSVLAMCTDLQRFGHTAGYRLRLFCLELQLGVYTQDHALPEVAGVDTQRHTLQRKVEREMQRAEGERQR